MLHSIIFLRHDIVNLVKTMKLKAVAPVCIRLYKMYLAAKGF